MLVHIKRSNVIDKLCLTDFGFAKTCDLMHPHSQSILGTPEFMAPEVREAKRTPYDPFKADSE